MSRQSLPVAALLVLLTLVPITGCQSSSPADLARSRQWNHYGALADGAGAPVALGAIAGGETDVVVEGEIADVCAKKGCWMRVADGDEELFVRFKDYGFFVPRNAMGHRVVMRGTAESKVLSVDELRHYAEDAGKSPDEIAAITEPESSVTFMATSVYIDGDGLDAPWSAEE